MKIIAYLARAILHKKLGHSNSVKRFNNFSEAQSAISELGYNDKELCEVIYLKTRNYVQQLGYTQFPIINPVDANSLLALLISVSSDYSSVKTINVLDVGGACGIHYFTARRHLSNYFKLRWAVVEVNAMIELAKQLETDELKFYSTIQEAVSHLDSVTIVFTSGAIQCINDGIECVREIVNLNASWIYFGRLALTNDNQPITVLHNSLLSDNGPGDLPEGFINRQVVYPFTFLSEQKFLFELNQKYTIVNKFQDNSGSFSVQGFETYGYSLLCRNSSLKF